jgi:two-component system cell cycle sensor histidine kinase PleC
VKLAQSPAYDLARLDEDAAPAVFEALHCLRVAITVFDAQEKLLFCNEHFAHLLPAMPAREKLIGRSYAELIRLEIEGGDIVDERAIADLDAFIAWRRAQFRAGEYQPLDITLADGRIIEIKARRSRSGGWIALWSDATQARHSQARLEDAIELTADAFAFFDAQDRIAMCNTGFAKLHGRSGPEEMARLNFADIVRDAVGLFAIDGSSEEWIARRIETHLSPAGALTVETQDGLAYLVRERATRDGGRVSVFTDMTDRQRIEAALAEQKTTLARTRRALAKSKTEAQRQSSYLADLTRQLDAAASDADTTKTTLLRTMSHELKTPLNAIIGFSDLLHSTADRFGPEQVKEYASLIHQGGHNLLRLINQILDLTKISAGRYELRRVAMDAGSALWLAKDALDSRAQAKAITLDADACPIGILADADEAAFAAMTHQLIENAINFTQKGGEVRLAVTREKDRVRVRVTDNGPGVATSDIARLLRPFEQGGRGTCDHTAGAGLGLTLVQAFAEIQGGSLSIDSAPGEGFTATIELPAAAN